MQLYTDSKETLNGFTVGYYRMRNFIEFVLLRFQIFLIALIPFRVLYFISGCCSFLLQYVIRYRLSTVTNNLRNSFPAKTEKEIEILKCNYYKNLCDVILESFKGYSEEANILLRKYQFLNPSMVNQYYENGQDVIMAMSHYCNWEWGSQTAGIVLKHRLISFYKPMSNRYADKYFLNLRIKNNMELLSIYDTKYIFRTRDKQPKAYFFISDQNPGNIKKIIWTKFLNQDTACLCGIESYAKLFNLPVFYVDIQRTTRGYYTVEFLELCTNPSETMPGEITEMYMRKLESIIRSKPEDWLWSHRRWKLRKS